MGCKSEVTLCLLVTAVLASTYPGNKVYVYCKQALQGATQPFPFKPAHAALFCESGLFVKLSCAAVIAAGSLIAGAVWSVALTPDGRRVLTASEDFTARVWDVVSGNCAHVLDGHTGWVVHVCTTADGLRCATASHDGTAR